MNETNLSLTIPALLWPWNRVTLKLCPHSKMPEISQSQTQLQRRKNNEQGKSVPGDFEYPEKSERTQDADTKGGAWLECGPDDLHYATYYHLKGVAKKVIIWTKVKGQREGERKREKERERERECEGREGERERERERKRECEGREGEREKERKCEGREGERKRESVKGGRVRERETDRQSTRTQKLYFTRIVV